MWGWILSALHNGKGKGAGKEMMLLEGLLCARHFVYISVSKMDAKPYPFYG